MPYTIKDTGKPGPRRYAIVKKATGQVVAHAGSEHDAGVYVGKAEGADKHSEVKRFCGGEGSGTPGPCPASGGEVAHVVNAVKATGGQYNHAPLHAVRQHLAANGITQREQQDKAIKAARFAGKVGATAMEGRISDPVERKLHLDNGIKEGDSLLSHLHLKGDNFSEDRTAPSPRLASVKGVELFDTGTHKGKPYDDAYVESLHQNFHRLSAGDKPLLTVPAVLGHEEDQELLNNTGLPAAGRLVNVYRKGTKLVGDFDDVPEKVAQLINQRAYRKVSAEMYDNFSDQGKSYGPTLRRIALLGGEVPQVKSLDDIPMAEFSQFCERLAQKPKKPSRLVFAGARRSQQKTLIFSELQPMDRAQMLAALQQMGFNVDILTDAVPDEVIAELLAALQANSNQATPGSGNLSPADQNAPPANSQLSEADSGASLDPATAPPASTTPAPSMSQGPGSLKPSPASPSKGDAPGSPGASTVPTSIPAAPTQHPSQVIMKYSEADIAKMSERLSRIETVIKSSETQAAQRLVNEKRANVDAFCERMVRAGKVLPAQLEAGLRDALYAADANAVLKFGEKSVSQLDLLMQTIEKGPTIARFSELAKDPTVTMGQVSDDRRKELLNKTVMGRAAAARKSK